MIKLELCLKDCNDFHQVKDGDGWVEQSSQPFLFGILQKVISPTYLMKLPFIMQNVYIPHVYGETPI